MGPRPDLLSFLFPFDSFGFARLCVSQDQECLRKNKKIVFPSSFFSTRFSELFSEQTSPTSINSELIAKSKRIISLSRIHLLQQPAYVGDRLVFIGKVEEAEYTRRRSERES